MRPLFRDAHHAWRVLGKNPLFTAIATLTLALGIGACVANFAVVRGVLLRPLPYGDPASLVRVYEANPARDANMSAFSPQDLDDFSRQKDVSEDLGAYWYSPGSGGPADSLSAESANRPIWTRHLRARDSSLPWVYDHCLDVLSCPRKISQATMPLRSSVMRYGKSSFTPIPT